MGVIRFRDPEGRTGQISESLEVAYAGEWEEEVEEGLRRIEAADTPDGRSEHLMEVYTRIVLELPEVAPIVEIERIDDPMIAAPLRR